MKTEAHHDAEWVMQRLAFTREKRMNYLLNAGPLPDGSLLPAGAATLKEAGRRIREQGWPKNFTTLPGFLGEQKAF